MKKVTVLGGGGTGCMMAADNALRGNEVRLWDCGEYAGNLKDIEKAGSITLTGQHTKGNAKLKLITEDLKAAVEGADIILISTLVMRHQGLCESLVPLLGNGQKVCFSAGNGSSIILKKLLGKERDIIVGEMSGNVIPSRTIGPAMVKCALPYKAKKASAFPARDTAELIESMKEVYEMTPGKDVLECLLNSPNLIIHLTGCILNTGSIDRRGENYKLYRDGLSDHVIRVMEQVDREKQKVMDDLGYSSAPHVAFMKQLMDYNNYPEFEDFRTVDGPSGMNHRYITEDAAYGQSIFRSLAKMLNIDIPCSEALLYLAGIINEADYLKTGKTLKYLGLDGMDRNTLLAYLQHGNITGGNE
jgi:opine dehydrogenase